MAGGFLNWKQGSYVRMTLCTGLLALLCARDCLWGCTARGVTWCLSVLAVSLVKWWQSVWQRSHFYFFVLLRYITVHSHGYPASNLGSHRPRTVQHTWRHCSGALMVMIWEFQLCVQYRTFILTLYNVLLKRGLCASYSHCWKKDMPPEATEDNCNWNVLPHLGTELVRNFPQKTVHWKRTFFFRIWQQKTTRFWGQNSYSLETFLYILRGEKSKHFLQMFLLLIKWFERKMFNHPPPLSKSAIPKSS